MQQCDNFVTCTIIVLRWISQQTALKLPIVERPVSQEKLQQLAQQGKKIVKPKKYLIDALRENNLLSNAINDEISHFLLRLAFSRTYVLYV